MFCFVAKKLLQIFFFFAQLLIAEDKSVLGVNPSRRNDSISPHNQELLTTISIMMPHVPPYFQIASCFSLLVN